MENYKPFNDFNQALELYQIDSSMKNTLQAYSSIADENMNTILDSLYAWGPFQNEFNNTLSKEQLSQVKHLQEVHWRDFFKCELNGQYVEKRIEEGKTYAEIGLAPQVYCAITNFVMSMWLQLIRSNDKLKKIQPEQLIESIHKLTMFDLALVLDIYTNVAKGTIREQTRALIELSIPIIQLWDGILLLPIVGILDSARAKNLSDCLLNQIAKLSSKASILDIAGMPSVDSAVASHLIKITRATKLLGCNCIISGISPEVAHTIVQLGIDLSTIHTTSTLQDAFQLALKMSDQSISATVKSNSTHSNGE